MRVMLELIWADCPHACRALGVDPYRSSDMTLSCDVGLVWLFKLIFTSASAAFDDTANPPMMYFRRRCAGCYNFHNVILIEFSVSCRAFNQSFKVVGSRAKLDRGWFWCLLSRLWLIGKKVTRPPFLRDGLTHTWKSSAYRLRSYLNVVADNTKPYEVNSSCLCTRFVDSRNNPTHLAGFTRWSHSFHFSYLQDELDCVLGSIQNLDSDKAACMFSLFSNDWALLKFEELFYGRPLLAPSALSFYIAL